MAMGLLALGCQSAPMVDPMLPLPATMSQADLARFAKRDFQQATAAFYRDDWTQLSAEAARLSEIGERWSAAKPASPAPEYQQQLSTLVDASKRLQETSAAKDVIKSTLELRRLATAIGWLERQP